MRRQLVPVGLLRSTLPGASAAETQSVPTDRSVLANVATRGRHRHTAHRARPAVRSTWKILTSAPGVASCLSGEKEQLSRLSLAALRLRLGRERSILSPSCPRRTTGKDVGSAIVAEPCVGVPTRTSSRSSTLQTRLGTESESHAPRLLAGPQSRCSSIESEHGRRGIAKAVVKDE